MTDTGPRSGHVTEASYRGGYFEIVITGEDGLTVVAETRGRAPTGRVHFRLDGGWVLPG